MKTILHAGIALTGVLVSLSSAALAQVPSADRISCQSEGAFSLAKQSPPLLRFDAGEHVIPKVNLTSAPGAGEPFSPAVFPSERLDPASQGRVTLYEVLACEGSMPDGRAARVRLQWGGWLSAFSAVLESAEAPSDGSSLFFFCTSQPMN